MINKFLWFILAGIIIGNTAVAQVAVLKEAVAHINNCSNFSYTEISRQKNPFSGDWTTLNIKSIVSRDKAGNIFYNILDARGYQNVYNGNLNADLDLNEKTYQFKEQPETYYESPYHWAQFIQDNLAKSPKRVEQLPDTIINNTNCFHIKLVMLDTIAAREIHDFYLSKLTCLPVYVRQHLEGKFGRIGATGDFLGVMINEFSYENYKVNQKKTDAITAFNIPADFHPEKKLKLLSAGQKAPDWQLSDLQGNIWSAGKLKGKIVLMDFSFNGCAACALSIPMLKDVNEKYKDAGVQVITVNTSDTKPSAIAFTHKYGVKYPVLLNGTPLSKSFQISAFPTFYLIDKQGNIAASFEGYGDELERSIVKEINKLM